MTDNVPPGRPAALCVVNTRRAARELFKAFTQRGVAGTVFHLSTWMCPAHRLEVLAEVRSRLKGGLPCFLISTQLIEAGVDLDFPLLLRELAPLDAVIQAAGRANREGTLNTPDGAPGGRVIVFRSRAALDEPGRYYPNDPWYVAGRDVLNQHFLTKTPIPDVNDPETIHNYFRTLLNVNELDPRNVLRLREGIDFPNVARSYRVIEESGQPVVIASWAKHRAEVAQLLEAVQERPVRRRFRALAPYQVNLRFPTEKQDSFVQEGPSGLGIWNGGYEPNMGLWDDLLVDQLVCV
jgi:CRISPR-associated endonuclease/helicase Cas3